MAGELIPGMSGMSGLMSLLQQQMERQAEEEPQRRAAVDEKTGALSAALSGRPDPNTESAQRLFAAAEGAGKPGSFWGALAEAGNKYITIRAKQEEARRAMDVSQALKEYEASRNAYKDFGGGAMSSTGAMTQYLHAALDPFKNIGGQGVNRLTGEVVIPKGYEDIHKSVYVKYLDQFTAAKDPDAAQKAKQLADWYVARLARNPNAATGPVQPGGGLELAQREAAEPPATAKIAGVLASGSDPEVPAADTSPDKLAATIDELRRNEQKAVTMGDYAKASELRAARREFEKAKPAAGAPPQISYKDEPRAKMEEATGAETGKALAKTYEDLNNASSASSELKMQLSALSELYKNPSLPEGAQAETLQKIRSSLVTLGLLDKDSAKNVGAADMVEAIGGKLALLTRTADGNNLMPGAMSNFEQEILRSLAPMLRQTQEGRLALVEHLNGMADVRIRLATEANKMAAANRGILPAEWYTRRDRILKEEMARMKIRAQALGARFGGGK